MNNKEGQGNYICNNTNSMIINNNNNDNENNNDCNLEMPERRQPPELAQQPLPGTISERGGGTGGLQRLAHMSNTGCDSNGIFLPLFGNRHKCEYTCL